MKKARLEAWILVGLLATVVWAQQAPPTASGAPAPNAAASQKPAVSASQAEELIAEARILYVARTLRLRADQIPKLLPLLQQVRQRLQERDQALNELWAKSQDAFASVNQALLSGKTPARKALQSVQQAIAMHDQIMQAAQADLDRLAGQLLTLLDAPQAGRVETPQERRARQEAQQRQAGPAQIVNEIVRYAKTMRLLLTEEYDNLRVLVAMRLAAALTPPASRGYEQTVATVLRILDSVRQLPDAQFSEVEARLPAGVARELGLPGEAAAQPHPISYDDLLAFLTHARTEELLQKRYQAEPAMEAVP